MILHPDGRVEGTPEEVVAYKLQQDMKALADKAAEQVRAILKDQLINGRIEPKRESIFGRANTDDLIKGPGNSIEQQRKYGHLTYKYEGPPLPTVFVASAEDWRDILGKK